MPALNETYTCCEIIDDMDYDCPVGTISFFKKDETSVRFCFDEDTLKEYMLQNIEIMFEKCSATHGVILDDILAFRGDESECDGFISARKLRGFKENIFKITFC